MNPAAAPIAPNQLAAAPTAPKIGRFRRGWELTKSAWHVLKLDRELTALPLMSLLFTLLALIPFGILAFFAYDVSGDLTPGPDSSFTASIEPWQGGLLLFGTYFVSTLVANFFSGAIIYGATQRFNGGDPTISTSLAGARRKFKPLMLFSLMMSTIGLALQMLEERLPLAGRIATYFFDAAWNIANIFAIPVIVLSEDDVMPLEATKRSVGVIKKVWGESIVANLGIGLIAFLTSFVYVLGVIALSGGVAAALNAGDISMGFVAIPIALGVIGAIALGLVFSALSAIAKAALYHYAVTGQAPGSFKRELLQSSMSPKKARKIFGL